MITDALASGLLVFYIVVGVALSAWLARRLFQRTRTGPVRELATSTRDRREQRLCPSCGVSTTVEHLSHFHAYRCTACGTAFAVDRTLPPEMEAAAAALAEVGADLFGKEPSQDELFRKEPHLGNMSTSSQRAHWLRTAFVARGLDDHGVPFVAARRQLARTCGHAEPQLAAKPIGYREVKPTLNAGECWSGDVPREGLFGTDSLTIDATHIRFGRTRVARVEALFFSIQAESEPLRYSLHCAYGSPLKSKRLVTLVGDSLTTMDELVEEMEGVLGWLEVEPLQ